METVLWYMVAFYAACAGTFALRFAIQHGGRTDWRRFFISLLARPLLVRRRYWDSVTYLQAIVALVFILLNVFLLFAPFSDVDLRQIEKRAALASLINIIPLCTSGHSVFNALNMPYSSYAFFHRWLGRTAVLQATTHVVIVLQLRPKPGHLTVSGWTAFSIALALLLLSMWFSRHVLGRFFLLHHRLLSFALISVAGWHVYYAPHLPARALAIAAGCVWLATALFRFLKLTFFRMSGSMAYIMTDAATIQFEVEMRQPVRVFPGCYFYLRFPRDPLHGYPMMAFWRDTDNQEEASQLTFLLSRKGRYKRAERHIRKGRTIILQGPYGQDLGLEAYENVILAAKGIGIAGVLHIARALTERKQHDIRIKHEIKLINEWQGTLLQLKQVISSRSKDAVVKKEAQKQRERFDRASRRKKDGRTRKELEHVTDRLEFLQRLRQESVSDRNLSSWDNERKRLSERQAQLERTALYRDATRKVDVFWHLDDNAQVECAAQQLKILQNIDSSADILVVWCGFPSLRSGYDPFPDSPHWLCLEPSSGAFDKIIESSIAEKRKTQAGRLAVLACGDSAFTNNLRVFVSGIKDKMQTRFFESEFRTENIGVAKQPRVGRKNAPPQLNATTNRENRENRENRDRENRENRDRENRENSEKGNSRYGRARTSNGSQYSTDGSQYSTDESISLV